MLHVDQEVYIYVDFLMQTVYAEDAPSAVITDIGKDNGKSLSMIYIINICTSFCFRPKRCELAHELNLPENTIKVIY